MLGLIFVSMKWIVAIFIAIAILYLIAWGAVASLATIGASGVLSARVFHYLRPSHLMRVRAEYEEAKEYSIKAWYTLVWWMVWLAILVTVFVILPTVQW